MPIVNAQWISGLQDATLWRYVGRWPTRSKVHKDRALAKPFSLLFYYVLLNISAPLYLIRLLWKIQSMLGTWGEFWRCRPSGREHSWHTSPDGSLTRFLLQCAGEQEEGDASEPHPASLRVRSGLRCAPWPLCSHVALFTHIELMSGYTIISGNQCQRTCDRKCTAIVMAVRTGHIVWKKKIIWYCFKIQNFFWCKINFIKCVFVWCLHVLCIHVKLLNT